MPLQSSDNPFNTVPINGTFADGSDVADGSYRVLLRALRVTGDRDALADYETWVSDEFVIQKD